MPTNHGGICAKHFEGKYLKVGNRTTLRWDLDPVPTIYSNKEAIPPSVLPTPTTSRKAPIRKTTIPDQFDEFKDQDKIKDFASINESLCLENYSLHMNGNKAVFYKIETSENFGIPFVSEVIAVDQELHVKLFSSGSPIPLPHCFTSGGDCRLTKKSILANFPSYIRNFSESRTSSTSIIDELVKIRFKKPDGRPKFTPEVLQFALILRYTSLSAYKLLLNHFPLPSIRLLNKFSAGGVEPLKSAELLLNEKKIDKPLKSAKLLLNEKKNG